MGSSRQSCQRLRELMVGHVRQCIIPWPGEAKDAPRLWSSPADVQLTATRGAAVL